MAERFFAVLDENSKCINIVVGSDDNINSEEKMANHLNINVSLVKEYSLDGVLLGRGPAMRYGTFVSNKGEHGRFKGSPPGNPVWASWTFDEETWEWKAPIAEPIQYSQTYTYWWLEEDQKWKGYRIDADLQPIENPIIYYLWNPTNQQWENN